MSLIQKLSLGGIALACGTGMYYAAIPYFLLGAIDFYLRLQQTRAIRRQLEEILRFDK